jgi:hypothetical protein
MFATYVNLSTNSNTKQLDIYIIYVFFISFSKNHKLIVSWIQIFIFILSILVLLLVMNARQMHVWSLLPLDFDKSNTTSYCYSVNILLKFKSIAAKVDDYCLNDQQCYLGDKYTYCKYIIPRIYGKCRCPNEFHKTEDNRCLPSE